MGKNVTIDFSKATGEEVIEKTQQNADKETKKVDKQQRKKFTATQIVNRRYRKSDILTHEGHKLNIREAKFIDEYLIDGNQRQAVVRAGYGCGKDMECAGQIAQHLLNRDYIANEIQYRMEKRRSEKIADRDEIMAFFTDMMRGKILDQFDLPTTNGDKIKAACELAKRSIDFEDRLKEKRTQTTAPEVKISLKWEGRDEEQK